MDVHPTKNVSIGIDPKGTKNPDHLPTYKPCHFPPSPGCFSRPVNPSASGTPRRENLPGTEFQCPGDLPQRGTLRYGTKTVQENWIHHPKDPNLWKNLEHTLVGGAMCPS